LPAAYIIERGSGNPSTFWDYAGTSLAVLTSWGVYLATLSDVLTEGSSVLAYRKLMFFSTGLLLVAAAQHALFEDFLRNKADAKDPDAWIMNAVAAAGVLLMCTEIKYSMWRKPTE